MTTATSTTTTTAPPSSNKTSSSSNTTVDKQQQQSQPQSNQNNTSMSSSASNDDCADEVKVFNEEGAADEEQRNSENLSEEKTEIVKETLEVRERIKKQKFIPLLAPNFYKKNLKAQELFLALYCYLMKTYSLVFFLLLLLNMPRFRFQIDLKN